MELYVLIFSAFFVGGLADVRYDNFTVIRVRPKNYNQLLALKQLQDSNGVYSFWTEPTSIERPVDIMVPPQESEEFKETLRVNSFMHEVMIDNIQELIDNEQPLNRAKEFGWSQYNTLDEINDWMFSLEKKFSEVTVVKGGSSYEGRDILGVHISYGSEKENSTVFIEGGIHAREWISPATVTYIINQLLTSDDQIIRTIATNHDWYIFPIFNPDGYAYTFTKNRLWRKTRKPYGICRGIDLNRNWDYKWMQGGASSLPCMEMYAGPKPFSDVESQTLSKFINSLGSKLDAYFTFHSYNQMLMYPYGDSTVQLENYKELVGIVVLFQYLAHEVGLLAAESLAKRYETKYTVGNIAETIYIATGLSIDWVKATHGTRVTYSYELRDTGRYGFFLPRQQIIPTAEETMDSFVTIMTNFDKRT